ncbi:nuclear transcription factor Y subunit A-10-like [Rosa rugosa]|uniref:nuclear transcription factor Y subunit A-10-like n=1 Tax=Rosa rugosa TaxID=74645 RepID=UPI002B4140A1|nr:nuclear transcription factor Y subunit A-10-like [Rosa rugosa]XP_062006593.1 nuclear transcription factor Y subunit A-10-like [Rosa rugosa]XP_062006594.1 nuclear transcription factor Y subunit A-10-like [Rosa rugosa]
MAMQTVYFKEHEGLGQLSSVLPWWGTAFGSQQVYGESCGQSKPFTMELPNNGDQLTATKQPGRGTEQGLDKGNTNQFTIFPGDGQKSQPAISLQSSPPKYRGHFELGFSQPMICGKYPYMDQCYGLFSTYGPQVPGRIMLPLNLTTDEGPIYVNAKQYHGIIRRRQSRAKAVMENRAARHRKPYMHESRHLHAMRRPRGCGGRFLNTKTSNNGKGRNEMKQVGEVQLFRHSGSQSSEVLQSESGTLNSSKTNGSSSNISGSEVTSTYSRGDLDRISMNHHHLGPSVHSLSDMMDGRGMVMPTKWIAAMDNCCNLKV